MDQKKLVDAFNEIVRVDNEVHFNTTVYNLDAYTEVFKKLKTRTNPNSLSCKGSTRYNASGCPFIQV